MTAKVSPNPQITQDTRFIYSNLWDTLYAYAQRINTSLQNDGSEAATAPVLLASYTSAQLLGGVVVPASKFPGGIVYCSNCTSNKRLAISDGTNWRFPDGAIVS